MAPADQPSVLVVEDEPAQREVLSYNFEAEGFRVTQASNGEEALMLVEESAPDVIVLDWMLPNVSGIEVCRRLKMRPETRGVPIIMLSARSEEVDRVRGLETGADDYMIKPFELPELLARLRALLRRSQAATSSVLSFGPLELDTATRLACVRPSGQPVELGPREWTVMEYLLIHAPKPANKDKLLQALTGWDKEITPNAVEVYMSRLRGKLEPHGIALRAIRGFGYRLELAAADGHAQ